jgi:hypothetical protein
MRAALLVSAVAAVATSGCTSSHGSEGAETEPAPAASAQPEVTRSATANPATADVDRAMVFYASQPRHLRPIPIQEIPRGLPDLRASTCGACHREIYNEWRISTHARAWLDDAQFMEELHKSRKQGVDWMCVNCHTPVANQLPRLVAGLTDGQPNRPEYVDNPHYDEVLQLEAITCATCHVRDGYVVGPWGNTNAPHAVRKDPSLLTIDVCTQCHQAQAEFRALSLACVFDTGGEFTRGPYDEAGKTCQSCHMPEVTRPASDLGTPPRKTRRHWFGGSLIPKKPEFAAELKPLESIYPDGLAARWVDLPRALPSGRATLTFEGHNKEAGHMLPTGDPERFVLLTGEVLDAAGNVLARREVRYGSRYQWHPEVKKLDDTRLAPDERRRYRLEFEVPAKGPVTLRLVASKWRISQENFDYHQLEGRYVAGRTFIDDTRTLALEPAPPPPAR